MAGILNTTYQNTVNSLAAGFKGMLNNPYYLFNNYSPTIVTYYAINKNETTLDYSLKTSYAIIGEKSPIKYNKIKQFVLYDLEKVQLNLDNGEQGLESQDITGECYVLPNTIVPSAGDFFLIDQLKEKYLFLVESVNKDTMDNDANFYKISYRLEQFKQDEIDAQIAKEFVFTLTNSDGNISTLMEESSYIKARNLEEICIYLEETFINLFYNDRVQTFTYKINEKNMYDEFMIEFIIRNKLMKDMSKYIYVDHKTALYTLFPLDYKNSIFYYIEEKNKDIKDVRVNAKYIDDPICIFQQRYEDYFSINHKLKQEDFLCDPRDKFTFDTIPSFILDLISWNKPFDKEFIDNNNIEDKETINLSFSNILISYMNDKEITEEDLEVLKNTEFYYTKNCFYLLPVIIFCIKQYIKNLTV